MKWVITGGRYINNRDLIHQCLDKIQSEYGTPSEFIHGDCEGVDQIGGEWAELNNIEVKKFPAEWGRYGKRAGPIRNQQMANSVTNEDLCIAIWNGSSRGTKNMISTCESRGIPVKLFIIDDTAGK